MPIAEIVTIGTELLLGEIFDTNSRFLAREFRLNGIDLFRLQTIGDNPSRIAAIIQEALQRADIVITTGGLGPTVDDPTRVAVAEAFNTQLVFHPELLEDIEVRMNKLGRKLSQNQKKQAYIPENAHAIHNSVGTAPAFYVENNGKIVISLPGVPSEMEYLWNFSVLPLLKQKFNLSDAIVVRKLKTYGIGEGSIDELIGDLEESLNPTVGLSAHFGFVDIRISAKSGSKESALEMIAEMETRIRKVLPDVIFGVDEDSIEMSIQKIAGRFSIPPAIIIDPETATCPIFKTLGSSTEIKVSQTGTEFERDQYHQPVIQLYQDKAAGTISLFCSGGKRVLQHTRTFAGNPDHYQRWSQNILLGELYMAFKNLIEE
ncbi:MAG TPA: molybdopterin-binding protein [Anaerolineales bacterium]|nr:molybdopterin-binding protein [Anaerolineales bacterium]